MFAKTENRCMRCNDYEVPCRCQLLRKIEELEKIVKLTVNSIKNPAWSGICDEDVLLEQALIRAGYIEA